MPRIDLLGDRLLGPHRVDRHHPAPDVDLLEQLGDRRDLVGLLGADLLAQGQPVLAGPGGDDVQGAEILLGVVAAAGRLAVEGDDRPLDARLGDGLVAEAGDPGVEAGLEGRGLEQHQDATEDVLAGDAVGQVEDARQEFLLELGPAGDGGGPGGAGEDGQDGDDQDAGQRVPSVDVGAGILQGGEGCHDLVQLAAGARHRRPPATGSGSRHSGRYTRSGGGAQARKVRQIVTKYALALAAAPLAITKHCEPLHAMAAVKVTIWDHARGDQYQGG